MVDAVKRGDIECVLIALTIKNVMRNRHGFRIRQAANRRNTVMHVRRVHAVRSSQLNGGMIVGGLEGESC